MLKLLPIPMKLISRQAWSLIPTLLLAPVILNPPNQLVLLVDPLYWSSSDETL